MPTLTIMRALFGMTRSNIALRTFPSDRDGSRLYRPYRPLRPGPSHSLTPPTLRPSSYQRVRPQNFAATASDAELGPNALENDDGTKTPTGVFLEARRNFLRALSARSPDLGHR